VETSIPNQLTQESILREKEKRPSMRKLNSRKVHHSPFQHVVKIRRVGYLCLVEPLTPPVKPHPGDKAVVVQSHSVLMWLMNLFDPPPLSSMTFVQKVGRVVLLTSTLVVGSIMVAMLGALGLYLMERGREFGSKPEFLNGVCVIMVGVVVNAICVLILVQIKKADHKLVPPKE
jgi:hypothetical protein